MHHIYIYSTATYQKQGYFKVGMTTRDPAARVKEQDDSIAPEPPVLLKAWSNVKVTDHEIHKQLPSMGFSRVRDNREWFSAPSLEALSAAVERILGVDLLRTEVATLKARIAELEDTLITQQDSHRKHNARGWDLINQQGEEIRSKSKALDELTVKSNKLQGRLDSLLRELEYAKEKADELSKVSHRLKETQDKLDVKIQDLEATRKQRNDYQAETTQLREEVKRLTLMLQRSNADGAELKATADTYVGYMVLGGLALLFVIAVAGFKYFG